MAKVTLYKNLFPYSGDLPDRPHIHACHDLTQNYFLACKLVRLVTVLFQMRHGVASYSGYVFQREDPHLTVMLVHQGRVVRRVVFSKLGYGGLLRVEIGTRRIEDAVGLDVLASLVDSGFGKEPVGMA